MDILAVYNILYNIKNVIVYLIAVISLFQHIESVEKVSNCGRTNRLYLLGIVPTKIANEDVRGVFCGGYSYKEKNPDNFKWLTDASTNQRLVHAMSFVY